MEKLLLEQPKVETGESRGGGERTGKKEAATLFIPASLRRRSDPDPAKYKP